MCEVVGILTRVCLFNTSVLAECSRLDNCGRLASVSRNWLNVQLSADDDNTDDNDDDDDEVLSRGSNRLIRLVNCSTARSMLVRVVVTAWVMSVTAVDKLLARSLRLALKHTHRQHHQLLLLEAAFSSNHRTVESSSPTYTGSSKLQAVYYRQILYQIQKG